MNNVRDRATVTVTETVDGTVKRRAPRPTRRSSKVRHTVVDPRVMATAHRIRRPGEVIQIVSPTEVRLVPAPHDNPFNR